MLEEKVSKRRLAEVAPAHPTITEDNALELRDSQPNQIEAALQRWRNPCLGSRPQAAAPPPPRVRRQRRSGNGPATARPAFPRPAPRLTRSVKARSGERSA
jgi:hypothetical protein